MSSFIKPSKGVRKPSRTGGFQIRPKGAGVSVSEVLNRTRMASERAESVEPTPVPIPARAASITQPSASSRGASCPNPRCPNPSAPITDGFCSACGREVDSSNIVAEVQFGESASGAAVVHGTFVGADQGTIRSMGPGRGRMGGNVGANRDKTVAEARNLMWGYKSRLRGVSESAIDSAIMIFKLLLDENWLQGRGMDKVVPVCLYTACRREEHCQLMLIDFAELCHINVYDLGHVFKDLSNIYSFQNNNVKSVIPEDLMMRFAEKLDFGDLTNKVAADATRLCQRMGRDWMIMGRRPSGICGACLLMAARMWNFRRTVREVVYVVKVTTHTIEQRLDEFTITESSDLSIEDFLNQEFLESRHDPPAFYKQSTEWQEKKEKEREDSGRKRKRAPEDIGNEEIESVTDGTPRPSRDTSSMPPPPIPRPPPDTSKMRQVTDFLPRAFDSVESREIVTPFNPNQVPKAAPKRPKDVVEGLLPDNPEDDNAVTDLAELYGEEQAENGEAEETVRDTQPKRRGRHGKMAGPTLNFDEEWEQDETELENQINEVISDPHSDDHAKVLATAAHLAHIKAEWARSLLPAKEANMDAIIGEDEFADDPEVQFCMLTPQEAKIKEDIWLNSNKDWIRQQQEKEYKKQMEELGPPKRRRNRVKKPRIGEGQLTPASTPGEATIQMMRNRNTVSKRINYDAIASLFGKDKERGPGSVASHLGSETASRLTSRAGSVADEGTTVNRQGTTNGASTVDKPASNEQEDEAQDEDVQDEENYDEGGYNEDYEDFEHPGYGEDEWDEGDEMF
ncbi:hypothetical protein F5Y15DRAFT_399897 [Xylariaceae sp. FL0016]|nr:hypothetical protein F5Y15DRAFT_399897 [Xylariaceae sp. FL0016]